MKTLALFPVALALSFAANAQTAAPTLTAGADFKGLRFGWTKVSGASWYQLELRAHQTGAFVQQGDDLPASATSARVTFPLHLFDWTYARYRLGACNNNGCTYSPEVSVSNLRRDAVGYFKSAKPEPYAFFGDTTDISSDGKSFVASAPGESDPTPSDNYIDGGAAYVFWRGTDGKWSQRARLALGNHAWYLDDPRVSVATSGSGNTIAVGMPYFTEPNDISGYGVVDVYYAKPGTTTYTRKRITPPLYVEEFGKNVSLSESGYVLAVDNYGFDVRGIIYKSVNGEWQRVHDFPVEETAMCFGMLLSRDGKTVVQRCEQFTTPRHAFMRVNSGPNWSVQTDIVLESSATDTLEWGHDGFALDATGDTIAVQFYKYDSGDYTNGTGLVKVYKRGAAGYSQVATLTPGAWRMSRYQFEYGTRLSLSGDGHTLAVSDDYDNGTNWGPRAAPLLSGTTQYGAVYVYRLTDSWKLANMVKPNFIPESWMEGYFGRAVALDQTGNTLLVTMPADSSASKGVGGNWSNADVPLSGGVFMY